MTSRFSPERRSTWRSRFLAIARELEGNAPHRREGLDGARGMRGRFLPPRVWRGIRSACRPA